MNMTQEVISPKVSDVPFAPNVSGHGIGLLAKSTEILNETDKIKDVAFKIPDAEEVPCFAVVNQEGVATGILINREFQSELVKPFWKDIHQHEPVNVIKRAAQSFEQSTHILVVAETLKDELADKKVRFYLCHRFENGKQRFIGIFSSLDLYQHITEISAQDMILASVLAGRVTPNNFRFSHEVLSVYGHAKMARGVGGDYYSARHIDQDRILLTLCDVSGKGVSASLVSTLMAGMLQVYDFKTGTLGQLLKTVNHFLIDTFDREKFVTGAFVELNAKTGDLQLYDYGHSHIFLHRKTHFHRIKTGDEHPPLGVQHDGVIHANRVPLEPGDTLVLLTDGILEQRNDLGEEYGIKRVAAHTHSARQSDTLAGVGQVIINEINEFRGGQPQADDQTILIMHYHPQGTESK